ncbi:MAG: DUF362 domain-containing protein [Fibrobacteres bacterium]|nr:DUF362 domain-containing protein [Fibrobacterota bacterium]
MKKSRSTVFFADIAVEKMEKNSTLPAKFGRMLKEFKFADRVKDKQVGIKMHFGGGLGYTTIHPLFVKILVDALKEAGAKKIKIMDNDPASGVVRGYTTEILGCNIVSTFGSTGKYLYKEKIGFKTLDYAEFGGEAADCDFFIDLSHIKGHGDCGFGGALKNIAMGVVPSSTRGKIHRLEGGLDYEEDKCNGCQRCIGSCPNGAILEEKEKKKVRFFYHHCTYCQHCVMVCPKKAIKMSKRKFEDFSKGMALVTAKFLKRFAPENLLFINILTNITIYCDCWNMSTASLVPDIGIVGGSDIVAVETASLDLVKTENLIKQGLPKGRDLLNIKGHLFEKIHGKDPYVMVKELQKCYGGSSSYEMKEVK